MTADVDQDRRVTGVIQGTKLPVLSDGSRLFWAFSSPVHEESGYGLSGPTEYKVMRCVPHSSFMARSRITSCRLQRDPSPRPSKVRAVLATVKARPGSAEMVTTHSATAGLDRRCAQRAAKHAVGTKKRFGRTKKHGKPNSRSPPSRGNANPDLVTSVKAGVFDAVPSPAN